MTDPFSAARKRQLLAERDRINRILDLMRRKEAIDREIEKLSHVASGESNEKSTDRGRVRAGKATAGEPGRMQEHSQTS